MDMWCRLLLAIEKNCREKSWSTSLKNFQWNCYKTEWILKLLHLLVYNNLLMLMPGKCHINSKLLIYILYPRLPRVSSYSVSLQDQMFVKMRRNRSTRLETFPKFIQILMTKNSSLPIITSREYVRRSFQDHNKNNVKCNHFTKVGRKFYYCLFKEIYQF